MEPVVIVGPSGTGKGTLIARLLREYPDRFTLGVSHTSRKMREGEIDGVHYHFVDRKAIEDRIANGEFVEHVENFGNLYGLSHAALRQEGKTVILDLDIKGTKVVVQHCRPLIVAILAPNETERERRLRGRGTESEESIRIRMDVGLKDTPEIVAWAHRTIINDDLDTAFSELCEAIHAPRTDSKADMSQMEDQ